MRDREWDLRIVWNERHGRWWWNAWRESTSTELWGFTDSRENALRDMSAAVQNVQARVIPIRQDRTAHMSELDG